MYLNKDDYFKTSCKELLKFLKAKFEEIKTIEKWNHSKIGNHKYVFVDRYTSIKPDYDFIGLDALASNVAHDLTLDAIYNKKHDEAYNDE